MKVFGGGASGQVSTQVHEHDAFRANSSEEWQKPQNYTNILVRTQDPSGKGSRLALWIYVSHGTHLCSCFTTSASSARLQPSQMIEDILRSGDQTGTSPPAIHDGLRALWINEDEHTLSAPNLRVFTGTRSLTPTILDPFRA